VTFSAWSPPAGCGQLQQASPGLSPLCLFSQACGRCRQEAATRRLTCHTPVVLPQWSGEVGCQHSTSTCLLCWLGGDVFSSPGVMAVTWRQWPRLTRPHMTCTHMVPARTVTVHREGPCS
jgi:hypothetical protein